MLRTIDLLGLRDRSVRVWVDYDDATAGRAIIRAQNLSSEPVRCVLVGAQERVLILPLGLQEVVVAVPPSVLRLVQLTLDDDDVTPQPDLGFRVTYFGPDRGFV